MAEVLVTESSSDGESGYDWSPRRRLGEKRKRRWRRPPAEPPVSCAANMGDAVFWSRGLDLAAAAGVSPPFCLGDSESFLLSLPIHFSPRAPVGSGGVPGGRRRRLSTRRLVRTRPTLPNAGEYCAGWELNL